MQAWLAQILIAVLTKITSWLLTKGLEKLHGRDQKAVTDEDIDKRLEGLKQSYKEAFDGQKITPEQRKKLYDSISSFIRGDGGGWL